MPSARYPLRVGTGFSCSKALLVDGVSRQSRCAASAFNAPGYAPDARLMRAQRAPSARLISAKNLWILPKTIKESVDLPDFVKESVAQIQILCTF